MIVCQESVPANIDDHTVLLRMSGNTIETGVAIG